MTPEKQTLNVIKWMDREVIDQLQWLTAVKDIIDPKLLEAYEAGLRHGYMKAYSTFQLHGMIK